MSQQHAITRRSRAHLIFCLVMLVALSLSGTAAASNGTGNPHDDVVVVGEYTLEDAVDLGKGVPLGAFSGLVHIPGDPHNIYYTHIDRGPNGKVAGRTTFPLDTLVPTIYKIKLHGQQVEVLEAIPLKRPDGTPLSTRPNLAGLDETPYDQSGQVQLAFDPHGLDLEGISYNASNDTFWLADEYRGSLVNVRRDGTVLKRLVPTGQSAMLNIGYAQDTFPNYFANRPQNRGFEGVSVTPDGRYLFATSQNALRNPNTAAGNTSRVIRIVKVDLATTKQVGEYVYQANKASDFVGVNQADIGLADVHALNENQVLLVERDKNREAASQIKRIYKVDFSNASNVNGKSSMVDNGPTLEQMTDQQLAEAGVVPATKELVVDILLALPGYPYEKVEGMTLVDPRTITFCHDNDFGVSVNGTVINHTGEQVQCFTLKLLQPIN